jgi:hypothetical protein
MYRLTVSIVESMAARRGKRQTKFPSPVCSASTEGKRRKGREESARGKLCKLQCKLCRFAASGMLCPVVQRDSTYMEFGGVWTEASRASKRIASGCEK